MSKVEVINKEEGRGNRDRVGSREQKRGRRPKNQKKEYVLDRGQMKFFVDLSKEKESLDLIFDLLEKANTKEFGREVIFKDLALYALSKLTDKDLLKVQEVTLSKEEMLERIVRDYNLKHGTSLSKEDYFLMKEGIKI